MTDCRVYWGSHGCCLPRHHTGPHLCQCRVSNWQDYPEGFSDSDGVLNVGAPPYYGPDTKFYGEDAEALGLPTHRADLSHAQAIERQHEADWLRDEPCSPVKH